MTDLFSAYEVKDTGSTLHAYLIESTAPNNIDDAVMPQDVPSNTEQLSADDAIEKISNALSDALKNSPTPTLVVSIHGFNNPRDVILEGYWKSLDTVNKDKAINNNNNKNTVCIGYRWPSERMGSPIRTAFKAAPTFLIGLFFIGVCLGTISFLLHYYFNKHLIIPFNISIFAMALAFSLFLLRIIVYFRDGYRATSYGIPDLVEIIRQIDKKLAPHGRDLDPKKRVELSFIGHSMGAYVVTSVVRILSDVFDPATMREGLNKPQIPAEESNNKEVLSKIGHAFKLARLVLVSPDIPAEALISSRANFLSASLMRFEEKFLFSNEGDEVLRQISTTANYFSFPTKSNKFGYRLGNVCLPSKPWGITNGIDLTALQVGKMSIDRIYNELKVKCPGHLRWDLSTQFSYFDCTDCVDEPEHGMKGMKGMLTFAKPGGQNKLRAHDHLLLLLCYIIFPRKYDVHGGYFRSPFLSKLIYRLACIGYVETEKAYIKEGSALDTQCKDHQIKVLLKS